MESDLKETIAFFVELAERNETVPGAHRPTGAMMQIARRQARQWRGKGTVERSRRTGVPVGRQCRKPVHQNEGCRCPCVLPNRHRGRHSPEEPGPCPRVGLPVESPALTFPEAPIPDLSAIGGWVTWI